MKYFIVAGEKSGDLHASNLVSALKIEDASSKFVGVGGDLMLQSGVEIKLHFREMAYMGFIEVLLNLKKIFGFIRFTKKQIDKEQPDAVVLVDFSGFNLKIAKYARSKDIKVFYYISPKLWAWNSRRAHSIKKTVDHMFVILPFEVEFYKKYNYNVDFVGNPVNDAVSNHQQDSTFKSKYGLDDRPILSILPGSRKQEVTKILPTMLEVASQFQDVQIIVASVDTLDDNLYQNVVSQYDNVKLVKDDTYNLLSYSHSAIVTSGTATLETGLFNVPQVVCYKMGWINYILAKLVVNVKYISLVNIVAGQEVIKELLQEKFTKDNLSYELKLLLYNEHYRSKIQKKYKEIKGALGEPKTAISTAKLILKYLSK